MNKDDCKYTILDKSYEKRDLCSIIDNWNIFGTKTINFLYAIFSSVYNITNNRATDKIYNEKNKNE